MRLNLMSAVLCALGVAGFGYWLKLALALAHSAGDAPGERSEQELDRRRKRGLYANGLQAERTGARERAQQYFRYARSFIPAAPDRISRDDEGRALLVRKQQVESALARRP